MKSKILILDPSGFDSIQFSLSEGHFNTDILCDFFKKVDISLSYSNLNMHEFHFQHNTQSSLFVNPVQEETQGFQGSDTIYLSDSGAFSISSCGTDLTVSAETINNHGIHTKYQQGLWQTSSYWKDLSFEDKNNMVLAHNLSQTYDGVAVLSNDQSLRRQCRIEGINVYGTCSMIAGMVLTDTLSYQKGTYIYSEWLKKDPRWTPLKTDTKRHLRFGEILNLERERKIEGTSFWIDS